MQPEFGVYMGSTITKEQWKEIEKEIEGFFCNVAFSLDGYEVTVTRARKAEGRVVLAVYIDDLIKGEWLLDDCQDKPSILSKVWKSRSKSLYSPAKLKKLERKFGKRRVKEIYPDAHERLHWLEPYFPKASVLCRQFKTIEGLVLVKARCMEANHG
ncbi:hypothetical protein [Photobacterium atrarenae]|uniref:Reverse transcriptase Ty1/copia-type domain-containing protein n=1 Tax=Photobacterium atrarenae TaxID=865757 RepID=A0ABY5GLI9_9GAMM|nr:hypothetical protein [Photobacterium atrarenae]UTV30188.1 hypothetical protein NNL38_16510 [Photobacterium atrarenae]